ncbi:MAG: ribonuclease Z [Deltaproteobacteria bacterium]|nr:ribonuclease Z [Deltaproteobacteria bacterium]
MDCVVLGAGGMMPMPARLTTSVLFRHEGRMLMFDAGEGIQLALKKGGVGIRALDVVAISHLHADHVLGLPGVLMFRAQCDDPGPLTIIGPKGVKKFIQHTLEDLRYRINFEIRYIEWHRSTGGKALDWNGCTIFWEPLQHSTFCLGYRVEEHTRPGKFNLEKAKALGIPTGPLYGRLQAGSAITLDDGRTILPQDVLGPDRRGRIITFATDTAPCDGLKAVCQNADLAFIEGMFTLEHAAEAADKKHSTAASSAKIAKAAGVQKLVLVHISPRYAYDDETILKTEAQVHFENAIVARGLDSFEIPLPD